jgi:hypothetical protein
MNKLWIAAVAAGLMSVANTAGAYRLYWTPWVSEENGGPWTNCTYWDEAAVGFGCKGAFCDDIRMLCETFDGGMQLDPNSVWVTPWFSEEGALPPGVGSTQPAGNQGVCRYAIPGTIDSFRPGVMSGARCWGSNCDSMALECELPVKYNGNTAVPANVSSCRTVGPYSEEQGSHDFGANQYITSVTCTGGYCDNTTFTVCRFNAPF